MKTIFSIAPAFVINSQKNTATLKYNHCGECSDFLHEDIDGYGICAKDGNERRCSDMCNLNENENEKEILHFGS